MRGVAHDALLRRRGGVFSDDDRCVPAVAGQGAGAGLATRSRRYGGGADPGGAGGKKLLRAPEATPKSREQKRFARADKDDDGRITSAELFEPRRKAFAKLDKNGNGALSFDEWATKTVEKFGTADADRSGFLTPAEFATTAPKPSRRKAACSC